VDVAAVLFFCVLEFAAVCGKDLKIWYVACLSEAIDGAKVSRLWSISTGWAAVGQCSITRTYCL